MITLVGCENKAESGALIGGGSGAVAGGLIGSLSHGRAGEGALIGGAVGAIGGALVGHGLDEGDRKAQAHADAQAREYDERTGTVGAREWSSRDVRSDANRDAKRLRKADIIAWTNQGVRDDIIVDRIERGGTVFDLSAADQNDLRDRGVSETVIRAMRDTMRRSS